MARFWLVSLKIKLCALHKVKRQIKEGEFIIHTFSLRDWEINFPHKLKHFVRCIGVTRFSAASAHSLMFSLHFKAQNIRFNTCSFIITHNITSLWVTTGFLSSAFSPKPRLPLARTLRWLVRPLLVSARSIGWELLRTQMTCKSSALPVKAWRCQPGCPFSLEGERGRVCVTVHSV